jgi:ankyrin repeat protein
MWAKLKQSVVTEDPPPSAWDVVDVDKKDASGKTSLLNVCEKGNAAECRLLLIQRASPDTCATDGRSPLYMACSAGSLECARLLLSRQRATANLLTNAGFSPIFAAAQKGNLEILQLLLEERADVNLNAKDGRTPLYAACERGNEAIASRLIRLGVKVDAKRTDGSTALIAAVCSPSPQTLCIPSVVFAAERVRLSRREVPTYIV